MERVCPAGHEKPDSGHMSLTLNCRMEGEYIHEEDKVVFPAVYKWMKARAEA
jgi:hypothetical protein